MRSGMLILGIAALSVSPSSASGPITYTVTVNTSSVVGTAGSLDFNFNPGPLVTQAASLQILSFSSSGTLGGGPTLTGDVSGALPATLTFDNGTGFNDYFQGFTYGSTLSFKVSLYGPALSSPDGVSTSGSTFAFSMFSDAAGTIPVLTTDTTDGFAFTVNVNLDGTTTVTDFSSQTSTTAPPPPTSIPTLSLPALAALALLLAGLGGLAARRNTAGPARSLALAALLLLPLGFGTLSLSARPQRGHESPKAIASSPTLLTPTQISATASGLSYSRSAQTFNGTVTIKNVSSSTIAGPFQIVLNSLTSGVTLTNATGSFGGWPYITVPGVGSLASGQSATVNVRFKNPSNTMINFTPVAYAGSFN